MKEKQGVKNLVLISFLSVILFVQKLMLAFLPNIQLTDLLIILFSKTLGTRRTGVIVTLYVFLDSLAFGSISLIYSPFILIGWLMIPFLLNSSFRKVESVLGLAVLGIFFSLLYSLINIMPNLFIIEVSFWHYLLLDIPFEILLSVSSFLSIIWFYKPLKDAFEVLLRKHKLGNL